MMMLSDRCNNKTKHEIYQRQIEENSGNYIFPWAQFSGQCQQVHDYEEEY